MPSTLSETLRAELPAALSGAIPGAEGWALGDARTERLFDRAVARPSP